MFQYRTFVFELPVYIIIYAIYWFIRICFLDLKENNFGYMIHNTVKLLFNVYLRDSGVEQ
jgi:hypothetical protein